MRRRNATNVATADDAAYLASFGVVRDHWENPHLSNGGRPGHIARKTLTVNQSVNRRQWVTLTLLLGGGEERVSSIRHNLLAK